jgi:hypothetical protein
LPAAAPTAAPFVEGHDTVLDQLCSVDESWRRDASEVAQVWTRDWCTMSRTARSARICNPMGAPA